MAGTRRKKKDYQRACRAKAKDGFINGHDGVFKRPAGNLVGGHLAGQMIDDYFAGYKLARP